MRTKIKRFLIMSVGMTTSLFIVFMLFDYFGGNAREKLKEELILSVIVGVLTSAFLVFLTKFYRQPKD
jgi:membrane protein DedA with SNARE-associated domain